MTTVGGLFQKYCSVIATKELCTKLGLLLAQDGSPKTVKCTKRLYNSFVKHLDTVVSKLHYESISILVSTLSRIAKGSNDFEKFISFGLTEKISFLSWCETLFIRNPDPEDEEWRKMVDDVLFNLTVTLGHLEIEVQQEMAPLLSSLLKCVCSISVPCTAKIEAARGSNILLEACTVEYKSSLSKKPEMRRLIESMGKSIQYAGNFELQVTIAECLYRMTTATERISLARRWFEHAPPSVVKRFTSIREEEFEVDCRVFLNEINSAAKERTVFSLSCKRMFLGTYELHCPEDESLNSFWVDFNTGSSSITVFVDDPTNTDTNTPPEESVWEMVTVQKTMINHWTVKGTVQGGDLVLSVSLNNPVHTLLPSIPPSQSQDIIIMFDPACDPTHPTTLVFGSSKQQTLPRDSGQSLRSTSYVEKPKDRITKQSDAIKHIHINQTAQRLNGLHEISPIEVQPDTPAMGGQVNSQGSTTPTNQGVTPMATPATSTPKLRPVKKAVPSRTSSGPSVTPPCRPHPPVTPTSSARTTRPPLTFASSGSIVNAPKRNSHKSSLTVNAIVFESGKSRVIQTGGQLPLSPKSTRSSTERNQYESTDKENVQSSKSKRDLSLTKTSKMQVKPSVTKSTVANKRANKEIEHPTSRASKNSQTRQDFKTPSGRTQSGNPTRKQLSQLANFRHLESPDKEDTSSPVLDYEVPSAALREKLQSQETRQDEIPYQETVDQASKQWTTSPRPPASSTKTSHTSSPESGYIDSDPCRPPSDNGTFDREWENNDSSLESLCEMTHNPNTSSRQRKRVFNLSGAPIVKDKRLKGKRLNQASSRSSSLNSTCISDGEPVAIPDSLPPNVSQGHIESEKHQASQKNSSMTRRRSKRLKVPNKHDSFNFDSEDELDQSWEPVRKPKSANTSRVSTKSIEEKENIVAKPKITLKKPKRVLTSARTQKSSKKSSNPLVCSTNGRNERRAKQPSSVTRTKEPSKHGTASLVNSKKDCTRIIDEILEDLSSPDVKIPNVKPMSKQERKRIIDEVYDFTTPDTELPQSKISKTAGKSTELKKKQDLVTKPQACNISTAKTAQPTPPSKLRGHKLSPLVSKKTRQKARIKVAKEMPLAVSKQTNLVQNKSRQTSKPSTNPLRIKCLSPADSMDESEQDSSPLIRTNKAPKSKGENHQKLPKRKRPVVDHSDFDELLASRPKKHCQQKGRRSSGYFSPIESPNNSNDYEISSEEKQDNDPTFSPSDDVSSLGSEIQSIDEPIKDKGIDTCVTEGAKIPKSSKKHNPPPICSLPSSPSSSLHSSLVTADLNVTAGFEQICRSLISKSGAKVTSTSAKTHLQTKACLPSVSRHGRVEFEEECLRNKEDCLMVEDKSVEQPELVEDTYETISLTQLTRNIVNSHKQGKQRRSTTTNKVKTPLGETVNARNTGYSTDSKRMRTALHRPMADDQEVYSDVESESSQLEDTSSTYSPSGAQASTGDGVLDQLQDLNCEPQDIISNSPSRTGGDEQRLLDYSSEMRDLVTSFDDKLQNACKGKRVQRKRTSSKANQGELLKLWSGQQKEREQTLNVYHEQLCRELEVLEKDVTVTRNSEEQTTTLLKKQLKTLKQSLGTQQRQVDRLRTLQVSFHQHVDTLEKNQTKEQMGAQRSLKQEMHSLQKRLLGDYERHEVSRIKQSLHAMLLQV